METTVDYHVSRSRTVDTVRLKLSHRYQHQQWPLKVIPIMITLNVYPTSTKYINVFRDGRP